MTTKNFIPVVSEEDDYKLAFPATEEPQPNGKAATGISEKFAREDHVHPLQEGSVNPATPSIEDVPDDKIYARTFGDWVENSAKNTSYDNTLTSLPANDVQGAIDALLLELQNLIQ